MFTIHFVFSLQLPKMFPGLLMNLQVYAREVPLFSLQPGAVTLGFLGAIKAFAIQPNGTQTPLFKLNVVSTFVFWPIDIPQNEYMQVLVSFPFFPPFFTLYVTKSLPVWHNICASILSEPWDILSTEKHFLQAH